MNFIDKFLDLSNPLPRRIVRFLKLLRYVEERSKDLRSKLKEKREKHILRLKEMGAVNSELTSLQSMERDKQELINLSDYKIEIIKEINYIVETFTKSLSTIIEEGKKECEINLNEANKKGFPHPEKVLAGGENEKKDTGDDTSSAQGTTHSLLGNKKTRNNGFKRKKGNSGNISEYNENNPQDLQKGDKQKVYCNCKKHSYGKMIECENPYCKNGQWFHYSCVNLTEDNEPTKEWYCSSTCETEAKNIKKKNKRKKN